jgi:hypothetical protein
LSRWFVYEEYTDDVEPDDNINDEFGHQIKNYVIKPDTGAKTKLVHASRLKATIVPKRTVERNITEIANEVFDAVLNPNEQYNIDISRNEIVTFANTANEERRDTVVTNADPINDESRERSVVMENENELEWDIEGFAIARRLFI